MSKTNLFRQAVFYEEGRASPPGSPHGHARLLMSVLPAAFRPERSLSQAHKEVAQHEIQGGRDGRQDGNGNGQAGDGDERGAGHKVGVLGEHVRPGGFPYGAGLLPEDHLRARPFPGSGGGRAVFAVDVGAVGIEGVEQRDLGGDRGGNVTYTRTVISLKLTDRKY